MQVELFTLCDGAYNYDGRLTIVGTFDTIKEAKAPFRKSFSIAAILRREIEETGDRELIISITNEEGLPAMPAISMRVNAPSDATQAKLVIAIKFNSVSFKSYGTYKVAMKDNGAEIFSYDFDVSQ